MLILKSKIKQTIKKERSKAEKLARIEEQKRHRLEVQKIRAQHEKQLANLDKKHKAEIAIYRKALVNRDRQHMADVEAYGEYKDNKAFFRQFREMQAPEIAEFMRKMGGFFYNLNEGERRDALSRKTDAKVERKMRIVGA